MLKLIKGLIDGIKKFFGGIFKKKAKPQAKQAVVCLPIGKATGTEIVDPLGFTSAKFLAEFVAKTMLIFHSVEYIANQTDAEGVFIHRQNR